MVTLVVSIFLPQTIDFHEFDDPEDNERNVLPPSRPSSQEGLTQPGKQDDALDFTRDSADRVSGTGRNRTRLGSSDSDTDIARLLGKERFRAARAMTFKSTRDTQHDDSDDATPTAESTNPLANWNPFDNPEQHSLDVDSAVSGGLVTRRNLSADNLKRLSASDYKAHTRDTSLPFIDPVIPAPEISKFDDSKWSTITPALTNGGLVNAVRKSVEGKRIETLWIGTLSGGDTDRITNARKDDIRNKLATEYNCDVVWVSDFNLNQWYEHFCKLILWPVLHYQMPDHAKSKAYQEVSWKYYRLVNGIYAEKVIANYKQGDTIWVHDYHLMMVPLFVREKIPDARIGLFVHTSFPSPEFWRCVCSRFEMLRGMLGASLIAFQTREHAQHFIQCCNRLLLANTTEHGVNLEGRFTKVTSESIGFVAQAIDEEIAINDELIQHHVKHLKQSYNDQIFIVARDKLDNIRGIRQKFLAFELFLAKHKELRKKVQFMQIATSTTELVEDQTDLWNMVARINREHSVDGHQPLRFSEQDMPLDRYIAMLAAADIMLVTPLREGMGLTPQEFVHVQDGSVYKDKKHGVIILSEFTGTSNLFAGNDLSSNPWNPQGTADLISKAVFMSLEERADRWKKLQTTIDGHTGGQWFTAIQEKVNQAYDEQTARRPANIPRLKQSALVSCYAEGTTKLLILDEEGTLTTSPINPASFEELIKTLRVLTSNPNNAVYLTSHHDPPILEERYSCIPNLGLIASNGSFTHPHDKPHGYWNPADTTSHTKTWKKEIAPALRYFVSRISGAVLLDEWSRLVVDFSRADNPVAAHTLVGDLCDYINTVCKQWSVRAVPIDEFTNMKDTHGKEQMVKKWLIIESETDKVAAVKQICGERDWVQRGFDWVLVAGDGREDEGLFKWARDMEAFEKDVLDRRGKVRAFAAGVVEERARRRAESEAQRLLQNLRRGASFSLGSDDDEPEVLGSMRPDIQRMESEQVVRTTKTLGKVPLKVWTISLGPASRETEAQVTLAGGPSAMVGVLGKLAQAEREAMAMAMTESEAFEDAKEYHDDEDPGDDAGPSAGGSAGYGFGGHSRGMGFPACQDHGGSLGQLSDGQTGGQQDSIDPQTLAAHFGTDGTLDEYELPVDASLEAEANGFTYYHAGSSSHAVDEQDLLYPSEQVDTNYHNELESIYGHEMVDLSHGYVSPALSASSPAPEAQSPSPLDLSGEDIVKPTRGVASPHFSDKSLRGHDSPPSSIMIGRSDSVVSNPSVEEPLPTVEITSPSLLPAPTPRKPQATFLDLPPQEFVDSLASTLVATPGLTKNQVESIIQNARSPALPDPSTHRPWYYSAPALPLPIAPDSDSAIDDAEGRHTGATRRWSFTFSISPDRTPGPDADREFVRPTHIKDDEIDINATTPEERGVRPGRDLGDILLALQKRKASGLGLTQTAGMMDEDFPCLNSDNESEGTYQRNRARELGLERANKKKDKAATEASKHKGQGKGKEVAFDVYENTSAGVQSQRERTTGRPNGSDDDDSDSGALYMAPVRRRPLPKKTSITKAGTPREPKHKASGPVRVPATGEPGPSTFAGASLEDEIEERFSSQANGLQVGLSERPAADDGVVVGPNDAIKTNDVVEQTVTVQPTNAVDQVDVGGQNDDVGQSVAFDKNDAVTQNDVIDKNAAIDNNDTVEKSIPGSASSKQASELLKQCSADKSVEQQQSVNSGVSQQEPSKQSLDHGIVNPKQQSVALVKSKPKSIKYPFGSKLLKYTLGASRRDSAVVDLVSAGAAPVLTVPALGGRATSGDARPGSSHVRVPGQQDAGGAPATQNASTEPENMSKESHDSNSCAIADSDDGSDDSDDSDNSDESSRAKKRKVISLPTQKNTRRMRPPFNQGVRETPRGDIFLAWKPYPHGRRDTKKPKFWKPLPVICEVPAYPVRRLTAFDKYMAAHAKMKASTNRPPPKAPVFRGKVARRSNNIKEAPVARQLSNFDQKVYDDVLSDEKTGPKVALPDSAVSTWPSMLLILEPKYSTSEQAELFDGWTCENIERRLDDRFGLVRNDEHEVLGLFYDLDGEYQSVNLPKPPLVTKTVPFLDDALPTVRELHYKRQAVRHACLVRFAKAVKQAKQWRQKLFEQRTLNQSHQPFAHSIANSHNSELIRQRERRDAFWRNLRAASKLHQQEPKEAMDTSKKEKLSSTGRTLADIIDLDKNETFDLRANFRKEFGLGPGVWNNKH
ncbi:hypothetical protein CAC42_3116 [Sphaceloma murrayae]|uniref:Uncharacterized protein n=1 Tax=Sphaceloma murrayae TaxID=2082308 RepID=A0A2K1QRQ0_9PEZI|nr:hypothetical protein CAC42_3116 [Sphaceloma murrayae]